MIFGTLELLRNDVALDLSDVENYVVENYEGFGMPPLHRLTERGPLQHGESDRGYRLDPRMIQLVLMLRAESWAAFYTRRQELIDQLSPTLDAALNLRFTQPDGTVRQVDCYCAEGPQFSKRDAHRYQGQRAAVRLICPDPAWYDPTRQSVRIVGETGGSGFAFPMAVPWTFGGTTVGAETAIDYDGTWIEYPEIEIIGPIADPRIEHLDTGDVLDFDGTTIADGDSRIIDLRYGYKTVVDGSGANKIADLTSDSDLATFHLKPGTNNLGFSGTSAGTNTAIVVRWYRRYLGV
jgi:hypothetical protein